MLSCLILALPVIYSSLHCDASPTSTLINDWSESLSNTPAPAVSDISTVTSSFTGGIATFYYQDGNAGACGWYKSDSDFICAMDQDRFDLSLCGKRVQITNTANYQTISVTIADDCPTCQNANSIDLSINAFLALSNNDLDLGEVNIVWEYI